MTGHALTASYPTPVKPTTQFKCEASVFGEQSQAGSRQSRLGSQVCPRWDPGWDSGWDPGWDPANPTWDPDRDFGTSHMGSRLESQVGSRQFHPPSQLHFRQNPTWNLASNPRWDPSNPTRDPSFVPCKIPPIPCEIPGGIPQSHLGLTCL